MYPIKLQKTGMLTIQKVTVADCELINKMAGEVFPATYKEILSPEQLDYMTGCMLPRIYANRWKKKVMSIS